MSIAAIVLTYNEEGILEGALKSLTWADELIIVDSGSQDRTVEIARRYTDKIHVRPLQGFASQRNFAMELTRCEWVFFLDSDERVSPTLRDEMVAAAGSKTANHDAYRMPRRNFFLGREMRRGGWEERIVRLLRRERVRYGPTEIHERPHVTGSQGELDGLIYHLTHRDIASNLVKTRQYATMDSQDRFEKGAPIVTAWSIFSEVVRRFFWHYFRKRACLDGMEGFIESMYQAFSTGFVIPAMLWEHQRGQTTEERYRLIDQRIEQEWARAGKAKE